MTAHNNAGVAYMHEENLAEAEQSLRRSLEPTRTIARLEPKNRRWEKELATTLLNLGALLHKRKDYTQAEPFLREALAVRQGLASWDPKNTRWLRQLAHAWHRMAVFQFDVADSTNALASAQQSLGAQRRLLAIEPGDKQAQQEIREYVDKYRDRLSAAGLNDAAMLMVREAGRGAN